MSLDAKWNEGLKPDMPVAAAAKVILKDRFDTVLKRWMECEQQSEAAEPIHHLRVASRRASTGLRIFGDLTSWRSCCRVEDDLRTIRHVAGDVRDRDVFLMQLDEWAKAGNMLNHPGINFLAGIWHHLRHRRYLDLEPQLRQHKRLAASAAKIKPHGRRSETLCDRASSVIPRMLAKFAKKLNDPRDLHATRIAGKHLRYAIELFACCYSANEIEVPYAMLEELQAALGEVHDAEVNARRVKRAIELVNADSRFVRGMDMWLTHLQNVESNGPKYLDRWRLRWEKIIPNLDAIQLKI